MPMNAPVTEITGTLRTPTSYISGNSNRTFRGRNQPQIQRKVRAQKIEKSPKAASVLLASRPMRSICAAGMAANHTGSSKRRKTRGDCWKTLRFAIAYPANRGGCGQTGQLHG